jgi:hypothetical protein
MQYAHSMTLLTLQVWLSIASLIAVKNIDSFYV